MSEVNLYRAAAPTLRRLIENQPEFERQILGLWRANQNTNEIALALGVPEFQIANTLPRILERARAVKT